MAVPVGSVVWAHPRARPVVVADASTSADALRAPAALRADGDSAGGGGSTPTTTTIPPPRGLQHMSTSTLYLSAGSRRPSGVAWQGGACPARWG